MPQIQENEHLQRLQDHNDYLNSISASKSPCTANMGTRNLIPGSGKFQDPESGSAQWDELEATAHERIITSQLSFIRFMQSLHVPDDVVLFPPEGGWPQITVPSFALLGKSDKVVEVLRNMAYIKDPMDSSPREILEGAALFDYRDPDYLEEVYSGEATGNLYATEGPDGTQPRDVIGLTIGGRDTPIILLDCKYGIARWPHCGEGYTWFGLQSKGDPSNEDEGEWGGETAWPVEEFFDYIKAKFINLEQLAFNQSRLISKDLYSAEPIYDFEFFKGVYQKHGWPGVEYNKEACMKESNDHCKKHFIN